MLVSMATIQIQACKQIHSEASQEDPRLDAGKYSHYPDTGLQADPQRGQSRGPRLEADKMSHHLWIHAVSQRGQ
jgi:hypothetical protein